MSVQAAKLLVGVGADTSEGERKISGFVERQAKVLEGGFGGLGKAIGLAATTAVAGMVVRSVGEMAKLVDASERVGASFQDLAAKSGESSDDLLDSLKQASGGAISEYDLMLAANRSMMLGVADSSEEMAALMQVAATRGRAMGLTTAQAFSDIVTGLGRMSPMILDNLGIVIDAESTYAAYAASIGKTAAALTDIEKKQALTNRVMNEAVGAATVTASSTERMAAAWSDLKVSMGEMFAPAIAAILEGMTGVARGAIEMSEDVKEAFAAPEDGPQKWLEDLSRAKEQLTNSRLNWQDLLNTEGLQGEVNAQLKYADQLGIVGTRYQQIVALQQQYNQIVPEGALALAHAMDQVEASTNRIAELQPKLDDLNTKILLFGGETQKVIDGWNAGEDIRLVSQLDTAAKEVEAKAARIAAALEDVDRRAAGLADAQARWAAYSSGMDEIAAATERAGLSTEDAAGFIDNAATRYAILTEHGVNAAAAMDQVTGALVPQIEALGAVDDAWQSAMDGIDAGVARMATNLLPDMGPQVFGMMDEWSARYRTQFENLVGYYDDQRLAIIAQHMQDDAQAMREMGEAAEDAAGPVGDLLDSMTLSVERQLFDVIGADAFANAEAYRQALATVYDDFIAQGYSAEEAEIAVADKAAAIVSEVTQIHGGTLDDLADAAWRAEQNLWGTEAAAAAVLDLVGGAGASRLMSGVKQLVRAGLMNAEEGYAFYNGANEQLQARGQELADSGATADYAEVWIEEALAPFEEQISATVAAQRDEERASRAVAGAAQGAADKLNDLSGMLSGVQGLFDPSEVTQEQLDGAAAGEPQEFADNYLRRLRDEVQNGVDWEGVSIEDAAGALGMDPEQAQAQAEQVLNAFEKAWADSSLFADPANMKFFDMEAIQASLEQQLKSAEGEKNLRALFGIGEDADVAAIAALGLDIQSGLAAWLTENGFGDAGASLAAALGDGVANSPDSMSGIGRGAKSYVDSDAGKAALHEAGKQAGETMSDAFFIIPKIELPAAPKAAGAAGESAGVDGDAEGGGNGPMRSLRAQGDAVASGAKTVIMNNTVAAPHDIPVLAMAVARYLDRRK